MAEQSQRERIMRYAQDVFGTEAEYLWADTPDAAVFRHPASRKWYAIIMAVSRSRLGLSGEEAVDVLNIKCGPILSGSLRMQPGFLPAYHMKDVYKRQVLRRARRLAKDVVEPVTTNSGPVSYTHLHVSDL